MRKSILLMTLMTLILGSCRTKYIEKEVPLEGVRVEYKNNVKMDSVYIHDSINIYHRGDTVFKDKVKIVVKDRLRTDTIHKLDSIEKPVYINKEVVKEVKKKSDPFNSFLPIWVFLP